MGAIGNDEVIVRKSVGNTTNFKALKYVDRGIDELLNIALTAIAREHSDS